jgi:hypothetical protein
VLPGFPVDDVLDRGLIDVVRACDPPLRLPRLVARTYDGDIRFPQLRQVLPLPVDAGDPTPTLGPHIGEVVPLVAEEQVVWAYAPRVVASVADDEPVDDPAVLKHVRETVREYVLWLEFLAYEEAAVAVAIRRASPLPALTDWSEPFDLEPETIRDGLGRLVASGVMTGDEAAEAFRCFPAAARATSRLASHR